MVVEEACGRGKGLAVLQDVSVTALLLCNNAAKFSGLK